MDVAIAGGHGQIALRLTEILTERGDSVTSLIRKPEQEETIRAAGGAPVICDLEAGSEADVTAAIEGADAVVFAAGAGPGSGAERKWSMDYGGAVKLIAAAKAAGVARYVMVSAIRADPDAPGDDVFADYIRAKGKADAELAASGLDYTIVRPGRLTDAAAAGRVLIAERADYGEIPRSDVAAVIAAVLSATNTIGKTFDLIAGGDPIEEAVGRL